MGDFELAATRSETLDDFILSLRELRDLTGLSYRSIAANISEQREEAGSSPAASKIAHTTVSDAFRLGRSRVNPLLVFNTVLGLSVEDNILAVLEITHSDRHKRRERLEELLSEFSITHLRRAPALALSGGERRRVEIARCLAADPKYLLLDEPFAGVDPIAVGEIRHLVQDLKSRGIGVLITDHNVRETLEIVDRAYILHDGKVLMSGTTDEVVRDETVRRVYLGQNFRIG